MDLLYLVLIKFTKIPVFFKSVLFPVVHLAAFYLHTVVDDQEAALNLDCANTRKVEQGVLHIFTGDFLGKSRQGCSERIFYRQNRKFDQCFFLSGRRFSDSIFIEVINYKRRQILPFVYFF